MSNPLDTLASEASAVVDQHQNGDKEDQEQQAPLPSKMADSNVDGNDDDNTPLSVEEAAGGPPMPPAGQQGAALKEAIGAIPPPDDHIHIQSPAAEPATLAFGHGDAAMAAIDTRLDEDAPIPHTNGYLEQGFPQSNGDEQAQQPNELDYQRAVEVANSTSQDVQEGASAQQEHIPPMSMDVEHPQGLEDPELPLPITQSLESAREASLAVDSLLPAAPSASESLGEAVLPAPGLDNAQPLSEIEPESAATATLQEPTPSSETLPAGESTLSSIPDDPAPLPSQLINHTAPTTDATLSLPPITTEATLESAATPPQTLENGSPPAAAETQPERQANAPPASLSNLLDSSAPTPEGPSSSYAPIPSPSLAKRPFEDDSTTSFADANAAAEANYFGSSNAQEEGSEPLTKRQRVSPEAISEQTSLRTTSATAEGMQVDAQSQSSAPASADVQQQDQQLGSAMDADGDADADADAEGDSDMTAPKLEQQASADDSMIDQTLDMSMVSFTFFPTLGSCDVFRLRLA